MKRKLVAAAPTEYISLETFKKEGKSYYQRLLILVIVQRAVSSALTSHQR
jgi:hypothetical protein